jgi:hypothetical protein
LQSRYDELHSDVAKQVLDLEQVLDLLCATGVHKVEQVKLSSVCLTAAAAAAAVLMQVHWCMQLLSLQAAHLPT